MKITYRDDIGYKVTTTNGDVINFASNGDVFFTDANGEDVIIKVSQLVAISK